MKIKQAFLFQFNDLKKAMFIFYGVLALLLVFFIALFAISGPSSGENYNSFEFSVYLFMFLMGGLIFNQYFHMTIQNGISRKTMYISRILCFMLIAAIATGINMIWTIVGIFLPQDLASFRLVTLLDVGYGSRMDLQSPAGLVFLLFMNFFLLLLFTALGNFFAALYYKMNKTTAITVSICVPAIVVAIITLDIIFLDTAILGKLLEFFNFITGLGLIRGTAFAPWRGPVSCLIITALLFFIAWLLLRRMDIKK